MEWRCVQVVGEVYHAAKPYGELTNEERLAVQWDEPAVFLLKADPAAMFGYRVVSFSFGSVIDLESVMSDYFTSILVEYQNDNLGFSVQYPAAFEESTLTEDENGIAGKLADGKASFFAKRAANGDAQTLEGLRDALAQQPGVLQATLNQDYGYLTVQSVSEDGFGISDAPAWQNVFPAVNGAAFSGNTGRYVQFRAEFTAQKASQYPGGGGLGAGGG